MKLPRRGAYVGRLAFDGEFHTDDSGRRVVTLDEGKTWRYAARKDVPHNSRYSQRVLSIDGTQNQPEPEPHHFSPAINDPHAAGLVFHTDVVAPTVTGHTDAWKEA